MPTPGQLVNGMALALNLPKETVTVYDRFLAESGLRTKGGRGRSAAKVTPRDAATLLSAILMSEEIVDSENAARVAGWMVAEDFKILEEAYQRPGIPHLKSMVDEKSSFIDFIEHLIITTAQGRSILTNGTSITAEKGSPYAKIDLIYFNVDFDISPHAPEEIEKIAQRYLKTRIQLTATILVDPIIDIAAIFSTTEQDS